MTRRARDDRAAPARAIATILIVDDDERVRDMLADVLADSYVVRAVADGPSALALIEATTQERRGLNPATCSIEHASMRRPQPVRRSMS